MYRVRGCRGSFIQISGGRKSKGKNTTTDLFVRRSSGLVRTAGTWDVFIFDIGLISIGIAIAFNQLYIPAFYNGGSIAGASIVATLGMLFAAFTFWCWSVIFPRSGGAYVSLSRTFGPATAFVLTFGETLLLLFYAALASTLVVGVGFAALFTSIGLLFKLPLGVSIGTALSSPHGMFICSSLVVIACGLLLISGMRNYFNVQKVAFIIACCGLGVALVVVAVMSRETFVENFNRLMTPLTYDGVIQAAKKAGWSNPGFNWDATLRALVWPLLPLLGTIQSIAIGGEVKEVNRSQFVGMIVSLIVAGICLVAFGWFSNNSIGYDFQGAIGFNSVNVKEFSTPSTPYFTLLTSILSGNLLITIIVNLGFIAWIYFWIPAEMAYATRTMLAWSFDRLAPEGLGYVSPTRFTPTVAIGVSIIVSILGIALIAYTPWGALVFVELLMVVWGACMVAAIFFPYKRKEIFEKSPISRFRIFGIPVMTLTGLVSSIFMGWVLWMLWNDDLAAGHNPVAVGTILCILVLGIIIYIVTFFYRRAQGIKVERVFKEIPIE